MPNPATLRERLAAPGLLVAPGAYDAIGARLIEQAGFPAVYMTGAGTSAARGYPDFGLLTMSEMVENAASDGALDRDPADRRRRHRLRQRAQRDAHGARVRGARRGRDPHRGPGRAEALRPPRRQGGGRRARSSSRRSAPRSRRGAAPDFLVIARTDARAMLGLDEAIERANAALEAGADVAFVEATQTVEEVAAVPKRVNGPVPAQRGARRPHAGARPARSRGDGLQAGDPARADAGRRDPGRRRGAGRSCEARASRRAATRRWRQMFRRFGADEWDALRQRFNAGAAPCRRADGRHRS